MKNIIAIIIIALLTIVSMKAIVYALDKSIYNGCQVVEQDERKLFIKLDTELTSGTDMACVQAERLIDKIKSYGYTPIIIATEGQWIPNLGCQVIVSEE